MVLEFGDLFTKPTTYDERQDESYNVESSIKTGTFETLNNSTTLHNDGSILLPLKKQTSYNFELILDVKAQNTTPDFKFHIELPSGCTGSYTWTSDLGSGTSIISSTNVLPLDTTLRTLIIRGTVNVSTTSGDFQLQWAQNVSNASVIYVYGGSYLTLQKK